MLDDLKAKRQKLVDEWTALKDRTTRVEGAIGVLNDLIREAETPPPADEPCTAS